MEPMAAGTIRNPGLTVSRGNAMESSLEASQTSGGQVIFLSNLFIIVAFRAGQSNLGGVHLRLSVEGRTNLVFPVAVGTDGNFAHPFSESLPVNSFMIVSQNSTVALPAGLRHMPS